MKIAIVGRPNVGKSSIFNRILGSRKAIVESTCGTTRDRLHADIKWKSRKFTLIDTGGFEPACKDDLARLVLDQLRVAIEEADIIFLVVDGRGGIMPLDEEFAHKLRKLSKKLYLLVNKIDDKSSSDKAMEFFELALGQPYSVSALSGYGIDLLLDNVARELDRYIEEEISDKIRVAIVGRPNVGKSSFVNAILSQERLIVHHSAGTTRDSIDTDLVYHDKDYVLIDTAGIRHNTKIGQAADFFASTRSRESIRRCDVAIVIIDGFDGLREDDKRIIETVIAEGKAMIIVINKWDLTSNLMMSTYHEMLIRSLSVIKNYPVIFTSCISKRNIFSTLDAVSAIYDRSGLETSRQELKDLTKALNNVQEIRSKRISFTRIKQEATRPPYFIMYAKGRQPIRSNIKGYIEKLFRSAFDLEGVPLKIDYCCEGTRLKHKK